MRRGCVVLRAVRFSTVMLLCALLLPFAPGAGRVAASVPADSSALDARSAPGVEAWTRTLDPAVVAGSQMPLFNGVPLGDLFVYAYHGGTWTQEPFQLDEVDSGGTFVVVEDGVLDANDQLVFMASDLGEKAATYLWVDDDSARSYQRYEVRVTNPLNAAEEGWMYVYRSATLVPTFTPYVTWNNDTSTTLASTYIIDYEPAAHLGMDSLQLNGTGVDVVDRSKLRLDGSCKMDGEWQDFSINEDSEEVRNEFAPPVIQGPVRQGGGTLDYQSWAYASMFESSAEFDAGYVDPQCEALNFSLFRSSTDWRNPAESGMAPMTYFDQNTPGGVPVDGVYDNVPSTPIVGWRQVSGAKGSVVEVADINSAGATIYNYYKDDSEVPDPNDTGDQLSFADGGFRIVYPSDVVTMFFANYVLAANQGNVGSTYQQYYWNPLQTAATAQEFFDCLPSSVAFGWLPRPVYSGVATTFTAVVSGGLEPFTYEWTFGDGDTATGSSVVHTFDTPGVFEVTLTVSNECGVIPAVIHNVAVWEPGTTLYFANLPAVLRNAQ